MYIARSKLSSVAKQPKHPRSRSPNIAKEALKSKQIKMGIQSPTARKALRIILDCFLKQPLIDVKCKLTDINFYFMQFLLTTWCKNVI